MESRETTSVLRLCIVRLHMCVKHIYENKDICLGERIEFEKLFTTMLEATLIKFSILRAFVASFKPRGIHLSIILCVQILRTEIDRQMFVLSYSFRKRVALTAATNESINSKNKKKNKNTTAYNARL